MLNQPIISIKSIPPEATYPLRHRVLWPDKPLAYVRVEDDARGYHYGAFDGSELVAVISLFVKDGVARFRKFATHPDYQRQGIGSRLLEQVIEEARAQGAHTLWCDARQEAADFYRKFGMETTGAPFYKGSVVYHRMQRSLG
ncbi:GNAT family N-acetyltransferase [Nibrella saemangeumensis]|uniref:GNAT family N-acetyltransferase n=1 Tax=Nibrella saemangeumensis TaxID=1084526 RepID=A0ABP8NLC8_9BACT